MADNMFGYCTTAEQVLVRFFDLPRNDLPAEVGLLGETGTPTPQQISDALARIAELSRPVADEAARRVAEVLRVEFGGPVEAWREPAARVIDALGYTNG